MKNNQKKILIIIGIITIFAVFIIFAITKKTSIQTTINNYATPKNSTIATNILQQIQLLSENKIFFPNYKSDTNNIIYWGDKGVKPYKIDLSNLKSEKLTDNELLGIQKVVYAPDGKLAIVFSNYPAKRIFLYDFNNLKNIRELNSDIQNVVWSNNSSKIAYLYTKDDIFTLNISDPDGSNWKQVKKLNYEPIGGVFLALNNNILYYEIEPTDLRGVDLLKLDTNSMTESRIAENSNYISFSPDSTKIIIEKVDSQQETTKNVLIDNSGKILSDVNLDSLKKNQFAWSNNSKCIYNFIDATKLEKIDIETSQKQTFNLTLNSNIPNYNRPQNINSPFISSDNKKLFFTSNDYLYSINLE